MLIAQLVHHHCTINIFTIKIVRHYDLEINKHLLKTQLKQTNCCNVLPVFGALSVPLMSVTGSAINNVFTTSRRLTEIFNVHYLMILLLGVYVKTNYVK